MKQIKTELIFILDRSGSMAGLEKETIGGFNGLIKKQLEDQGQTLVTTVLFDNMFELLYEGKEAKNVKLSSKEYFVRGSTALLDAIGNTINIVNKRFDSMEKEESPDNVMFIITTDGYENSSREFSKDQIREMIKHQTNRHNWEFMYLGANIDTVSEARDIGISAKYAVDFEATETGVDKMYMCLNESIIKYKEDKKK
jgi:uncharacterized protein YegL